MVVLASLDSDTWEEETSHRREQGHALRKNGKIKIHYPECISHRHCTSEQEHLH